MKSSLHLPLPSTMLLALIALLLLAQQPFMPLLKKAHASPIDAQKKPLPATTEIQTGYVDSDTGTMSLQSDGRSFKSIKITYKNSPKKSIPNDRHITVGLTKINYQIYNPGNNKYQFRQNVQYEATLTDIVFSVHHNADNTFNRTSIRYLIIDPQSKFLDYIQLELVQFNNGNSQIVTFIHKDSVNSTFSEQNYAVATFLKHCIMQRVQQIYIVNYNLTLSITYNWNKDSLQLKSQGDSFQSLHLRVMIMYKNKFPLLGYRYDFIMDTLQNDKWYSNVLISKENTTLITGIRQTKFLSNKFNKYFYINYTEDEAQGYKYTKQRNNIEYVKSQIIGFNQYEYGCFKDDYLFEYEDKCYADGCPKDSKTFPFIFQLQNEGYQYYCKKCQVADEFPECLECVDNKKCSKCLDNYHLELEERQDQQIVGCKINIGCFIKNKNTLVAELCSVESQGCLECIVKDYDASNNSMGIECSRCENEYFLNNNQQCQACEQICQHCIICNISSCFKCEKGYTQVGQKICRETIELEQALQKYKVSPYEPVIPVCQDSQNCKHCNQYNVAMCYNCVDPAMTLTYYLDQNYSKCQIICGDSKIVQFAEECDDGNALNYDGCSSNCKFQESQNESIESQSFQCENIQYQHQYTKQNFTKTLCHFIGEIELTLLGMEKVTDQNRLQGKLNMSHPMIGGAWSEYLERDLAELMSLKLKNQNENGKKDQRKTYDFKVSYRFNGKDDQKNRKEQSQEDRRLLQQAANQQTKSDQKSAMLANFSVIHVGIDYFDNSESSTASLNHQTVTLEFKPNNSGLQIFSKTKPVSLTFDLITDNNQVIQYYDQDYYGLYLTVKNGSIFVSMNCLIMLLLGLLLSSIFYKGSFSILIALEYAAIVQLTLYSLSYNGELNSLLVGLAEGLFFVGGNLLKFEFSTESKTQFPFNKGLKTIGYQSLSITNNFAVPILLILSVNLIGFGMKCIGSKLESIKKKKQLKSYFQKARDATNEPIQLQVIHPQRSNNLSPANQTQQIQEQRPCSICFSAKLQNAGNILLGSIGLPLLIFLSYGIFLSIAALLNSADSLNLLTKIDVVLIGIIATLYFGYIWLIFKKIEIFQIFTFKIRSYQSSPPTNTQNRVAHNLTSASQRFNKKYYLISTLLERVINAFSLYYLGTTYPSFCPIVPIVLYIVLFIISSKLKFVAQAHKPRFYGNLLTGIAIQCCLLCRGLLSYFQSQSINQKGWIQSPIGQYISTTICCILIFICCLNLSYFVYSVKKIRCCTLSLQNKRISMRQRFCQAQIKISEIKNHQNKSSSQNQIFNDRSQFRKDKYRNAFSENYIMTQKGSKESNDREDNYFSLREERSHLEGGDDHDHSNNFQSRKRNKKNTIFDQEEDFQYMPKPKLSVQKIPVTVEQKPNYQQYMRHIKQKVNQQSSIRIKQERFLNNLNGPVTAVRKKKKKGQKSEVQKLKQKLAKQKSEKEQKGNEKQQDKKNDYFQQNSLNKPAVHLPDKFNKKFNCYLTNIIENPNNFPVSTYKYSDPNQCISLQQAFRRI